MPAVNRPTDPSRVVAHMHDTKQDRLGAVALALRTTASRCGVAPAKRGWERDPDHPGHGSYNERGLIRWVESLTAASEPADLDLLAKLLAVVNYRKVA